MEIIIIAVSCLIVGAFLGALLVTHPIAGFSPSADMAALKADVAALKAKVP